MPNAQNGERFLTGMANAYGRNGEHEIMVGYDLNISNVVQCILFIAALIR